MATRHPTPPTSSLPPLARLSSQSLAQVTSAIDNLRAIYCPPALNALPKPKALPKHLVHDISVPDSGYASAEGEDDSDDECDDEDSSFDIDVLRSDPFEREFAIRWLTRFSGRSDIWVYAPECSEEESNARAALVDAAASLIGSFAGEDEEEAVTRTFTFPVPNMSKHGLDGVHVELNDAPLLSDDHTSVGLQSWGSSIRLAERMCMEPDTYALSVEQHGGRRLRILELGAGTGLLSIAAAKLLGLTSPSAAIEVVATDYHPSVLDNLRDNVRRNFSSQPSVEVLPLDWQSPIFQGSLAESFDVVLAADVIYHPEHARWIKTCVEHLLKRDVPSGGRGGKGVFWLIIPLRPTGRHEGMSNTVEAVFPHAAVGQAAVNELSILRIEEIRKQDGIGRADEGGYKLYEIGWA